MPQPSIGGFYPYKMFGTSYYIGRLSSMMIPKFRWGAWGVCGVWGVGCGVWVGAVASRGGAGGGGLVPRGPRYFFC